MTPETLSKFWKSLGRAYKQLEIIEIEELLMDVEDSVNKLEEKHGKHALLNVRMNIEKVRKRINEKVIDLVP